MTSPATIRSLTQTECTARLARGCVGRVGFVVDGHVHVLPVNYSADATGEVLYRTEEGALLASVGGSAVVFEIDGFDEQHKTGWSVCVHGTAHEVLVPRGPTASRLIERAVISWAPGARDRWFAIRPRELTGRQLPMSGVADRNGWIEGVVS